MKSVQTIARTRFAPLEPTYRPIERLHLCDLLNQALGRRLTIVHSAAGYGKTSLLTQWLEILTGSGVAAVWLTLDEEEQCAGVFLSHLTEACRPLLFHGVCGTGRPDDIAAQKRVPDLPGLVNAVAEQGRELVIFMDDYHLAQSDETDTAMRTLVRDLPRQVHLVVASRTRPNFGIENLRARNDLLEITAAHLRFSEAEASELLQKNGLSLDPDQAHRLTDRTEGWPIALQMASLWVEGDAHKADMISDFSGRTSDLAQYLSEQVFSSLPPHYRNFLLKTSELTCFNGDVANAVTGSDDGWRLIEELLQRNLFLVAENSDRSWFRYHTLFREYLQEALRRKHPGLPADLNMKASECFRRLKNFRLALRHAMATEDPAAVARLLADLGGWRLALGGHLDILQTGLRFLPDAALRDRPNLLLARVMVLIKDGALPAARRQIDALRGEAGEIWTSQAQAERNVIEHVLDAYEDVPASAASIRRTEELLHSVPRDDHLVQAMLLDPIAAGYYDLGQMDQSLAACALAIDNYRQFGSFYGEVFIHFIQGNIYLCRGQLDACRKLLQNTRQEGEKRPDFNAELVASSNIYLARVLYELNELDEARSLLDHSLPLIEQSDGWFDLYIAAYEVAAAMAWRTDGLDGVSAVLKRMTNLKNARSIKRMGVFSAILNAHYHCRAGDGALAEKFGSTLQAFLDEQTRSAPDIRLLTVRAAIGLAEIHLAHNRPQEAENLLRSWLAVFDPGSHLRRAILCKLALARAFAMQRDINGAAQLLHDAVTSGMFCGLRRLYIDNCHDLLAVIDHILEQPSALPEDRFRDRFLLSLRRDVQREQKDEEGRNGGVSSAERQILEALDLGYSNKEIAKYLKISPNTVKYRLKIVFQKMRVTNRADLVRLYRESLKGGQSIDR